MMRQYTSQIADPDGEVIEPAAAGCPFELLCTPTVLDWCSIYPAIALSGRTSLPRYRDLPLVDMSGAHTSSAHGGGDSDNFVHHIAIEVRNFLCWLTYNA